ncbi:uncharacterized protein BO72DRAFT_222764 [Aspergillus fijiensis CBS 313.89]|uniref:Uncharacterized protein n=1 Tax=Aspergillus fijiensis CBS 313.89 TaxID=1448319 RepID=A0A8G1RJH2_9EURO|nr:uncharacterized protein BO72DRAFT_222764 [Aspergillus fijiensis CBS 313.89]RAK73934.1 hypothetical protein BO72DRAFT_222764 [Aspergillus fijiensis CBS 313.89]
MFQFSARFACSAQAHCIHTLHTYIYLIPTPQSTYPPIIYQTLIYHHFGTYGHVSFRTQWSRSIQSITMRSKSKLGKRKYNKRMKQFFYRPGFSVTLPASAWSLTFGSYGVVRRRRFLHIMFFCCMYVI